MLLVALAAGVVVGFAFGVIGYARAAPDGSADISTSLVFECLPDNNIRVEFSWSPSGQGPQWLDLSLFDNDFAAGTFLTSGPLPGSRSSFTWDGLIPDTQHFVRVNTQLAGGWAPSQTMAFVTPNDCPFAILAPAANAGTVDCPGLRVDAVSGCVWTARPDYGVFEVGEIVNYCFFVSQPAEVKIIAFKPDGSALLIVDGFVDKPGACVGPYQANVPRGLRTVRMYGGPDFLLLDETHFYVQ
jgi:hypothetical protein